MDRHRHHPESLGNSREILTEANYWNVEDSTNSVQQIREDDSKVNNLNLSETNKEDNILTDRNEEQTKVHKQKLKNAMSLLKVKKVDGSIDDIPF